MSSTIYFTFHQTKSRHRGIFIPSGIPDCGRGGTQLDGLPWKLVGTSMLVLSISLSTFFLPWCYMMNSLCQSRHPLSHCQ